MAAGLNGNAEIAGLDIAGLDNEGLDIGGLDNDGLDIAGLDIVGLDNDGRICEQLTEVELLNSVSLVKKIFTPFLFLKHTRCLFFFVIYLVCAVSSTL